MTSGKGKRRECNMAKMRSSSVRIRSACVLGAGTMGAQIAAHLGNAGYSVSLLDVSAQAAREGLERARKLKPDPFFAPDRAGLHSDRRVRLRPGMDRAGRLDHRSRHRAGGGEAVAPRARGCAPSRRLDRQLQHVGPVDCGPRGRAQRRLPQTLARHALFQSTSIPAIARNHSDGRHRSGRYRRCTQLRRSPARKERRHRERTHPDSSPITSLCTASFASSKRSPPALTPSKR